MILKPKGNVPKVGSYNYNSYLTELMNQRNGSQSQLNHYENFLNVELNDQYRAHGLRINNQISGQKSVMQAQSQLPQIESMSRNLSQRSISPREQHLQIMHGANSKQFQRLNSQFLNVSPPNIHSQSPSSIPSLPNIERSHHQSVSSVSSLVLNRNPDDKWIQMQMKRDKLKNIPIASIVSSNLRDRGENG